MIDTDSEEVTMSVPTGTWNVVTNLHNAVLNITGVDDDGKVSGTIELDASNTHPISGTWSATTNEISFSYEQLPVNAPPVERADLRVAGTPIIGQLFAVDFQGYLFQAGKPLFNASPGPTSAAWDMMAGTWGGESTSPTGWVARSQQEVDT